jgi:iron transport multicopper oxidase
MKSFSTTSCILATVLLLLISCSLAEKVVYDWNLEYKNVNPDGLHERRVISINDQWPYVFYLVKFQ